MQERLWNLGGEIIVALPTTSTPTATRSGFIRTSRFDLNLGRQGCRFVELTVAVAARTADWGSRRESPAGGDGDRRRGGRWCRGRRPTRAVHQRVRLRRCPRGASAGRARRWPVRRGVARAGRGPRPVIVAGLCELDDAPSATAPRIDRGELLSSIARPTFGIARSCASCRARAAARGGTGAGRIGVAVCYDAFFPEMMRMLSLAGADIIAVPMNAPVLAPPLEPLAADLITARQRAGKPRLRCAGGPHRD